jgi:hypothetical protein
LQIFDVKEKRIFKVKEGIQLIFSHFEGRQPLFPRKMSTAFSNNLQFTIYTLDQILNECIKANFLDCRINAYPVLADSTIPIQTPNIIFIDLDLHKDLPYGEALKLLYRSKDKSIKTIKDKLDGCNPTVLWTGNGYHIHIVLETRPLELITELKELSNEPSKEFLKFGECFFSNNKSDPSHNPSFQSLLLKIPFTFNSKCIKEGKDAEVKITQKFDSSKIPQIDMSLLREFRLYLADKDIENKRNIIKRQNKINNQQFVIESIGPSYQWIETLLKTPLKDHRKFCLWRIFIPYFLNIRKLTNDEVIVILTEWLNACNDLEKLDFEPLKRIKENIKYNKSYFPISKNKLKEKNKEMYKFIFL